MNTNGKIKDWHRIAEKLPGRSNKDCRKRWFNEVTGGLKKGPWDKDEDARLRNGIQKHGYKYDFTGILMHTYFGANSNWRCRWAVVAQEVGSRSGDRALNFFLRLSQLQRRKNFVH